MKSELDDSDKLTAIHHWENQAGRILRLVITILGVGVSGFSLILTVFLTSSQIPGLLEIPSIDLIIENFANNPLIGFNTALVTAFFLLMGTFVFTFVGLFSIFILTPLQSLNVMEPYGESSKFKDMTIEEEYSLKSGEWDDTINFLKMGFISIFLSAILSIPLFVSRNSSFALFGLFTLLVIGYLTASRYSAEIIDPLIMWSKYDIPLIISFAGSVHYLLSLHPIIEPPTTILLISIFITLVGVLYRNYRLTRDSFQKCINRDSIIIIASLVLGIPLGFASIDYIGSDIALYIVVASFAISISFTVSLASDIIGILWYPIFNKIYPLYRKIRNRINESKSIQRIVSYVR